MTWGCWVRTDTLDGAVSGRPKALGNDNGGWGRVLGLDNRINTVTVPDTFRYTTFTGNDPINNAGPVRGTPAPVSTNDWTFLAATYDQVNKTVTMYVDLDASTTDDELVSVYERGGFRVGQETVAIGGHRPDSGTESWVGGIDNVFIFSGILTDAELKNLRDKGKAAYIASAPKVTDVVYNPDGTVALVWSSDPPPVNYAVLYSPDITLPISSWNVENTSVASGGFTTSYTTGTTFSQDQLFFVIRRNP